MWREHLERTLDILAEDSAWHYDQLAGMLHKAPVFVKLDDECMVVAVTCGSLTVHAEGEASARVHATGTVLASLLRGTTTLTQELRVEGVRVFGCLDLLRSLEGVYRVFLHGLARSRRAEALLSATLHLCENSDG